MSLYGEVGITLSDPKTCSSWATHYHLFDTLPTNLPTQLYDEFWILFFMINIRLPSRLRPFNHSPNHSHYLSPRLLLMTCQMSRIHNTVQLHPVSTPHIFTSGGPVAIYQVSTLTSLIPRLPPWTVERAWCILSHGNVKVAPIVASREWMLHLAMKFVLSGLNLQLQCIWALVEK